MAERFSFDKCITKMENLYTDVINNNLENIKNPISNIAEFHRDITVEDHPAIIGSDKNRHASRQV